MKQQHISTYLRNARSRARRDNVPFSLTKQYLLSIATDECPIFHTPFEWGVSGLGKGNTKDNCPTLDRILPELGYVEGNVAFISYRANRIKDNGTMQEHYDIADWIWNHTHAKQKSATSVPAANHFGGEVYPELRSVSLPGFGENGDYPYDYQRAVCGENFNHSTQESSGDSMGHRGEEVGTSFTLTSVQIDGKPKPKISWVKLGGGHLPDQS
jgi:hypothetical protein